MPSLKQELVSYFQALGYDQSLIYLLALKHNLNCSIPEEQFMFLTKNNFIKRDLLHNKIICVVPLYEGEEAVEEINSNIQLVLEIESRIDEYRKLFKYPNIRSGMMGNKQTCIEYLIRWCSENKKTFDDVLKITENYISYTELKYLPNADNFIYSLKSDGIEVSKLTLACEEQGDEFTNNTRTWDKII